jgi:hypothetical protein
LQTLLNFKRDGNDNRASAGRSAKLSFRMPSQPRQRRGLVQPRSEGSGGWQGRFYDLNVWSEKKRMEKLNDVHSDPVPRGMVASPDQWSRSSFRFCSLEDDSILPMNRVP